MMLATTRGWSIRNSTRMAAALICLMAAGTSRGDVVVFDAVSSPTLQGSPAGTPGRSFLGQAFNAADPGVPLAISGFNMIFYSNVTATYNDLRLNVQFYNSFDSTAAGGVFSNPAGSVQTFDLGSGTLPQGFYNFTSTVPFATPIALSGGLNGHGVVFNFQVDTGNGLVNTDDVTTAIRTDTNPLTVGSIPLPGPNFGYYRNASGRTDFNFNPGDRRMPGPNSALAIQLYAVPEPGSMILLAVGAVILPALRARRRAARP